MSGFEGDRLQPVLKNRKMNAALAADGPFANFIPLKPKSGLNGPPGQLS
jgi:hypothetical protein